MRDNHGPAGTTPRFMYIVAIAWIYVELLMSVTEATLVAGVATFVFYGLAPLAVLNSPPVLDAEQCSHLRPVRLVA